MSTLFESLFERIDNTLDAMMIAPLNDFIATTATIVAPALTIWIIIKAINAFRGHAKFEDLIYDFILAGVVISFATSLTVFNSFIKINALEIGNWIASIASSGTTLDTDSVGETLDVQANKFFDVINQKWSELGRFDFGGYVILGALFFTFVILLVIVVYSIGMGKVGSVILITLGPLFILALLFKSTKNFFTQWLGFLINFQLTIGLSVMLLVFFVRLGIFTDLQKIEKTDLVGLMMPFVLMGVFIQLMRQVPHLATALSGGIVLSVDNLVNKTLSLGKNTALQTLDTSKDLIKGADDLTGNKASKKLDTFKDKFNDALENRGIPTRRAASEKKAAYKVAREMERKRRIAGYAKNKSSNQQNTNTQKTNTTENVHNSVKVKSNQNNTTSSNGSNKKPNKQTQEPIENKIEKNHNLSEKSNQQSLKEVVKSNDNNQSFKNNKTAKIKDKQSEGDLLNDTKTTQSKKHPEGDLKEETKLKAAEKKIESTDHQSLNKPRDNESSIAKKGDNLDPKTSNKESNSISIRDNQPEKVVDKVKPSQKASTLKSEQLDGKNNTYTHKNVGHLNKETKIITQTPSNNSKSKRHKEFERLRRENQKNQVIQQKKKDKS